MRTGPKPTPQALVRPSVDVPDTLITPPEPPSWCEPADAQAWWELSQCLIGRGQLTRGDLPVLEAFVLAKKMVNDARQDQRWRDCDKFQGTLARLSRELGLSPVSREAMRPTPAAVQQIDDLERFKAGDYLEDVIERRHRLADCD